MDKPAPKPDFKRLKALRLIALVLGAMMFAVMSWALDVFTRPDLVTFLIAFAFASIMFSAAFYFGALLTERALQTYVLRDKTVIKGDNVDMVTETKRSGDPETDQWVRIYVFSRNLFGLSILPLAILIWLYFYG